MNRSIYCGVEITDTWSPAKLMPGAQLTPDDHAERFEAFVGDKPPYRRLAAGSHDEMRRLIREAKGY